MEIKWETKIDPQNMYLIEILNKQHYFIIKQENSKLIISQCRDNNNIYEYSKNKEKINSIIFCAFINYNKKVNDYEIIIRFYNIDRKKSNNINYINYLLKFKKSLIISNINRINLRNIFKEIFYIQINSISIKNNILKGKLKEITLIYEFENKNKYREIRIFGDTFVKNNKNKLRLIINGIPKELKAIISIKDIYTKNKLKIKIIQLGKITKLNEMFAESYNITKISMISKWNTNNVTNMRGMFYNCESLKEMPNI